MSDPTPPALVHKVFRPEFKVLDEQAGTVEVVMSDERKDREGDIIRNGASSWDLTDFEQHPVLLAGHNYAELRAQIGEWHDVGTKSKRLVGEAEYYLGRGNPDADWGFELARRGRAAYSVGFIPGEVKGLRDGGYDFVSGHKLLETSHVTIPANPGALQLMMRSLRGSKSPVADILEELAHDAHEQIKSVAAGKRDVKELDDEWLFWMAAGLCQLPDCEQLDTIYISICRSHMAAVYELVQGDTAEGLALIPPVTEPTLDSEVVAGLRRELADKDAVIATLRAAGAVDLEPSGEEDDDDDEHAEPVRSYSLARVIEAALSGRD